MPNFLPARPLADLKPGEVVAVQVGGHFLALYLVDGQPFCTEGMCSHEGLPIGDGGWLEGDEVQCPWHGARFNVKTGAVAAAPAEYPLRTFPVEVRDEHLYIGLV